MERQNYAAHRRSAPPIYAQYVQVCDNPPLLGLRALLFADCGTGGRRLRRISQPAAIDCLTVARKIVVVVGGARGGGADLEAWILRAMLTVDEGGNVPGLLDIQAVFHSLGHVGADEGGGFVDGGHAGTPIIRFCPPEWGVSRVTQGLACTVFAVAGGALLGIHDSTARFIERLSGGSDFGEAAGGQAFTELEALRHVGGIGFDGIERVGAEGRRRAVEAIKEAILRALLEAVDGLVFGAVGGEIGVGSPQRGGTGLAASVEMAISAGQRVADMIRGFGAGVLDNSLAATDGITPGIGRGIGGEGGDEGRFEGRGRRHWRRCWRGGRGGGTLGEPHQGGACEKACYTGDDRVTLHRLRLCRFEGKEQAMRTMLFAVVALLASPVLGQALPKAVPSAGAPRDVAGMVEKPDPALKYRILYDVSAPNRDLGEAHQTLRRAASLLNAMAANGVKPAAGDIAIVVHGAPDSNLLTDAAHMKRFGTPNPSRVLVEELAAAGVSVRLCGQSYLGHGYAREELLPVVQLDLMAMVTIANLMARGYGVVRDD